jgi:hypothetical protein
LKIKIPSGVEIERARRLSDRFYHLWYDVERKKRGISWRGKSN